MTTLNLAAILVTLAAVFSYINHRYIRLPNTIGIMLIALAMSISLLVMGYYGLTNIEHQAQEILAGIDFNTTLMHGMLSFLLFAGALHVNLSDLADQKWVIAILATFGVTLSTFLIGGATWYVWVTHFPHRSHRGNGHIKNCWRSEIPGNQDRR